MEPSTSNGNGLGAMWYKFSWWINATAITIVLGLIGVIYTSAMKTISNTERKNAELFKEVIELRITLSAMRGLERDVTELRKDVLEFRIAMGELRTEISVLKARPGWQLSPQFHQREGQ